MVFFFLELIGKRFTFKLLCISWTEAERFSHEVGIPRDNIYVIPNSITIPKERVDVPDKLGRLEGEIKIGTIGRITYQKTPLLLADIAYDVIRKNPSVHFHFLGAGQHQRHGFGPAGRNGYALHRHRPQRRQRGEVRIAERLVLAGGEGERAGHAATAS